MRFLSVTLHAPAGRLLELAGFYGRLGLEVQSDRERAISFRAGETELELVSSDGEPFYHFALLVPGNRFEAAYAAAGSVAELLPERETGDTVFDSDNWSSLACYFHDPAGNIVELIAHRGLLETAVDGEFGAAELIGLSELGLVGDRPVMAAGLAGVLGLELWDGTLAEPTRLAFVGEWPPLQPMTRSSPARSRGRSGWRRPVPVRHGVASRMCDRLFSRWRWPTDSMAHLVMGWHAPSPWMRS